jgi:hypothetical protein
VIDVSQIEISPFLISLSLAMPPVQHKRPLPRPDFNRKERSIGVLTARLLTRLPITTDSVLESWELSLDDVARTFKCGKGSLYVIGRRERETDKASICSF